MAREEGLKLVLDLLFGGDIVMCFALMHFALAGVFVRLKPFPPFFYINSLSR